MTSIDIDSFVETRLQDILEEMKTQDELAIHYSPDSLSFGEEIEQIREYVEDAGEYSLAYESIVVNLEEVPFGLSSSNAIKLLEVGLIMKYKTERDEDVFLDSRE